MEEKKINLKVIIPIAIAAVIIVLIALILGISNIASPQSYLEKGDFRTAYMKAKDEEKSEVLLENLVTVLCGKLKESYKNPSSFQVNNIWKKDTDIVVLSRGENELGGTTANYSIYRYVQDEEEYVFATTVMSLEQEKINQSDDKETVYQTAYDNVFRKTIKTIISDENKLENDMIKRINKLSHKDKLSEIKLLDETIEWYRTTNK